MVRSCQQAVTIRSGMAWIGLLCYSLLLIPPTASHESHIHTRLISLCTALVLQTSLAMHSFLQFTLLSFLLVLTSHVDASTPIPRRHGLQRCRRTAPHLANGPLMARADPADEFKFSVTLKGNNLDGLTRKMYEISHSHGNWLTHEQLREYTKPTQEHQKAFHDWLDQHGIDQQHVKASSLGDHFTITSSVATAEKMLSTRLYSSGDKGESQQQTATGNSVPTRPQSFHAEGGFNLPSALQEAIAHVTPLNAVSHGGKDGLGLWKSQAHFRPTSPPATANSYKAQMGAPVCNSSAISAECLRTTYKIDSFEPKAKNGFVDVGIGGWIGEGFQQSSLDTYIKALRPEAAGFKMPVWLANGSTANDIGGEGDLDVQMAVAVAWPLNLTWFSFGNGDPRQKNLAQETFEGIIALPDSLRPGVISFSYAAGDDGTDGDIAAAACAAAQKVTALGTTIIFSSGDGGVTCFNDRHLSSWFPCSCPYVVAVGATEPPDFKNATTIEPETILGVNVNEEVESGIGFSKWFDMPDYQKDLVTAYLNSSANFAKGHYREGARFSPDIASLGAQFYMFSNADGGWTRGSGTSVSAPMLASMLGLVNAARRDKGLGTVGFVQPLLYTGNYTDITTGTLYQCDMKNHPGFNCTTGFDITGLGSPRLTELFDVFVNNATQSGGS